MTATTTVYALDRPINERGGPEHARKALAGAAVPPANYRFAAADGTKLVYHVCGAGPELVLATSPGWGPGINYLASGLRPLIDSGRATLAILQTRGTLPSERPADESRMGSRHMAADLDALRRHLFGVVDGSSDSTDEAGEKKHGQESKDRAVTVLGHSNGAAIALAYAADFPSRCARAILLGTQVIGAKDQGPIFMRALEARQDDPRFAPAVARFRSILGAEAGFAGDEELTAFINEILPLYFWDPATGTAQFAEDAGGAGGLVVQNWPNAKQRAADAQPEAVVVDDLSKVTADVLIVSGREDFICSVEASRFAQQAIGPKAKHVIYEECGHMSWIEKKDELFKEIMAFLA
ncbi:alpha/beta hydrolase family domain-containing protein [Purpureocillium lavendulum]|uniref:Alpha/beta hydrolase family domain-containing protein n=1 Tax=Purpureocillium lavendulum TaxID=1247861 RepID=A0AB34FGW2_9HYPO|nr:alpha/beta hydrolase family domain-containing protein [Purpureocillium lavendulum]